MLYLGFFCFIEVSFSFILINYFDININFIKLDFNKIKQTTHIMSIKPKLPIHCPSCESELKVTQLSCEHCQTIVNGNFSLPLLLQLGREEQEFILAFFLNSGSLKQMAQQMNISYPTVRNKLDDMIEHIQQLQKKE
ncbi:hypothetical protein HMPREF9713_01958 [Myroides odoratimimus CCUG 12700]|nr:hypothetical protein HMPREF9713_01958 [Myroides odoratimimus CCUG 12700]